MALLGMDVEAGAQAAQTWKAKAGEVKGMASALRTSMNFQWPGPDGDRTRQECEALLKTIDTNATAIEAMGQTIDRNVKEQQTTSSQ